MRARLMRRRLLVPAVAFIIGALLSGASAVYASHQFSDVPTDNPFHADIDWMVDNGIADGYADGTFKPTNPVSRQAFAAFLHRYNSEIEMVMASDSPSVSVPFYTRTVTCPPGKRAIGGGGNAIEVSGANLLLAGSGPTTSGDGWTVMWTSRTGGNVPTLGIVRWVACAPT